MRNGTTSKEGSAAGAQIKYLRHMEVETKSNTYGTQSQSVVLTSAAAVNTSYLYKESNLLRHRGLLDTIQVLCGST
jgi:glutamine amidotransferase PdxT